MFIIETLLLQVNHKKNLNVFSTFKYDLLIQIHMYHINTNSLMINKQKYNALLQLYKIYIQDNDCH